LTAAKERGNFNVRRFDDQLAGAAGEGRQNTAKARANPFWRKLKRVFCFL
jgi:hypothetical protein